MYRFWRVLTFLFLLTVFTFNAFSFLQLEVQSNNHQVRSDFERQLNQPHRPGMFRVKFKDHATREDIFEINTALGNSDAEARYSEELNGTPLERVRYISVDGGDMVDQMVRYSRNSYVESVEPIFAQKISWSVQGNRAIPNDWDATKHWYFDKIGLPETWNLQDCPTGGNYCGGNDEVVVAVIDTGLTLSNHISSFNHMGIPYNNIEYGVASEMANVNLWTNPTPGSFMNICNDIHGVDMEMVISNRIVFGSVNCQSETFKKEGHPSDDEGHGTFVTGIISSATNNSAGSVGVAHNVSIMPIKANFIFTGLFWYDTVEQSIAYAIHHGADVINMSLGGSNPSVYKDVIDYAVEQGIVVVAAVGNTGEEGVMYPAALSSTIAVGAINHDNSLSSYSTTGPEVDFVAPVGDSASGRFMWHQTLTCSNPGCDESSDFTNYELEYGVGTSYASPQVAATVALIKSYDKNLATPQIKKILEDTAIDLGTPGKNNQTGYGLINLPAIYNYLSSTDVYTLEYIAGSGGSIEGNALQSILSGGSGTQVRAAPSDGYRFKNWSDARVDNPRIDSNVTNNIQVTAEFEPDSYTITFDPQGGAVSPLSKEVTYGYPVGHLPTPARSGYSFAGWNSQSNGQGTNYISTTVYGLSSNSTLYAQWSTAGASDRYTLRYTPGSNGTIDGKNHTVQQNVLHGTNGVAVTAIPNSNYRFDTWSDGRKDNPRIDVNVHGDIHVIASFVPVGHVLGEETSSGTDQPKTLPKTFLRNMVFSLSGLFIVGLSLVIHSSDVFSIKSNAYRMRSRC